MSFRNLVQFTAHKKLSVLWSHLKAASRFTAWRLDSVYIVVHREQLKNSDEPMAVYSAMTWTPDLTWTTTTVALLKC
jgi:hypothetical protein